MANDKKSPGRSDLFKRLTQLFRGGPTIRKKVRAFRTPTASTAAEVFKKSYSQIYSNALNSFGSYDRMSRYADATEMEYCLAGDTRIAVPGGYKTLQELTTEYGLEKEFYVYAYDHELKKIVPAVAKQARQTRVDHAWKVTFDSGHSITGSANHLLMLRDGTYRRIDELRPGDSMMPFYRRDFYRSPSLGADRDAGDGYRWIYTTNPTEGRCGWVSEHRMIASWVAKRPLLKDEVVHHINFKKHDNRPENLLIMDTHDHATLNNEKKWVPSNSEWIEKFRKQHSEWMKQNNPAERVDITFARILDFCQQRGFNLHRVCEFFDTDPNVIKRKLRRHGFQTFETFARAYVSGWRNASWDNAGPKNPRYDRSLSFQAICDVFQLEMSLAQLCGKLQTTPTKVTNRLKAAGYRHFRDYKRSCKNHKVVSIEYAGEIPLFDITVDGYKNFATDSVMSHNTAEIASALDIYSEEAASSDDKGNILHLYSNNPKIQQILSELFHDTLNIEFNLVPMVRNLVKFGDFFWFLDIHPEMGVINAFPMPVNEVERDEGWDPNDPLAVRFRWVTQGNQILESWQVAHFRLLGNDAFLPYGSSVLESARRIWRQLILIEDAMLVYRVVRSPERRVFYIDVGTVETTEIPNYMEAAQSKLKRSPVIDKSTGRIDLRYNPLPVWSQSRIPLLDGRTITIEELAREHDAGKENWVYSVQDGTHRLVPGRVAWCGKNYTAERLIRVWLDDDTWVMTAPEHPFLLRDGTKRRADELRPGDSLMPLYRRLSSKAAGDYNEDYEVVYDPGQDDWIQTHRAVSSDSCVDQQRRIDEGVVIHHMNHRKWDNRPTNLQRMGWSEHKKHHAEANRTPEHRAMVALHNKRYRKAERMGAAYNGSELHKEHNRNRSAAQLRSWSVDKPARSKAMEWRVTKECVDIVAEKLMTSDLPRDAQFALLMADDGFRRSLRNANRDYKRPLEKLSSRTFLRRLGQFGYRGFDDLRTAVRDGSYAFGPVNHRVASIEWVDGPEDVYCMTVVGPAGEEDRHNFTVLGEGASRFYSLEEAVRSSRAVDQKVPPRLASGIIVVNSIDEDYFIPVRGGESGTKIDTLAGGQHVSDIADVEYIQKKLFAALKVPRAYLGYDESLCLVGETRVPLLDGTEPTIAELAQRFAAGNSNGWTYSIDETTNRFIPGKIVSASLTKHVDRLYRVTLDDGTVVRCTDNHPFMLRDGGYLRADELSVGTSLRALYRRRSLKVDGDLLDGYDMVRTHDGWEYTHKLVNEAVTQGDHEVAAARVIHHVDCDKTNNEPSNLQEMTWAAHRAWHQKHLESTLFRPDVIAKREPKRLAALSGPVHRQKKREQMLAQHADTTSALYEYVHSDRISIAASNEMKRRWKDAEYRQLKESQLRAVWDDPEVRTKLSGDNHWCRRKNAQYDLKWLIEFCKTNDVTTANQFRSTHPRSVTHLIDCSIRHIMSLIKRSGYTSWKDFATKELKLNHSVVSIEIEMLKEPLPVYDLTIEGLHGVKSPNFLINPGAHGCGGIVVHNSSKSTLAQEDIRFSRLIHRIQQVIISELQKIAIIHLFAHGFEGDDLLDFDIQLSNPSTVAQQQKLELWRTKFEIAGTVPDGLVDRDFLRREIFQLTDEQIERIAEGRRADRLEDMELEASELEGNTPGGGGGGGGGLGGLPGGGGGGSEDLGGSEPEGGAGGEEPAAGGGDEDLFAGDEPEGQELLTSADDDSGAGADEAEEPSDGIGDVGTSLRDALKSIGGPAKAPARVTPLSKHLYNRGRRRTHGPRTTHMPDFNGMVSYDADPHDRRHFNASPFAEGDLHASILDDSEIPAPGRRRRLTAELRSMLSSFGRRLSSTRKEERSEPVGLLAEGEIDLDIESES